MLTNNVRRDCGFLAAIGSEQRINQHQVPSEKPALNWMELILCGPLVLGLQSSRSPIMIRQVFGAAFIAAAAIVPLAASAQGVPEGVERGAREGDRAAGPVGAIVGGTIGGVVGGVTGILGVDQRPRFHRYVVEQRRPSYRYQGDIRVGAELPEAGVTYYDVPQEYGVREYRYTVVNDRPVLVDPRTHRIVEVVE